MITCPQCGLPLVSFNSFQRYRKCTNKKCGSVWWEDGPSLLPKKDPQRKHSWTGQLIRLTDAQIDWLVQL